MPPTPATVMLGIDMGHGPTELLANAGMVNLVSARWLSNKDCGCVSEPALGKAPPPPSDGYILSTVVRKLDERSGVQVIKLCRPCAVKLAVSILDHEVK